MLLTFCINAFEIHIRGKQEVERLLHVNAAHVVAMRIDPMPEGATLDLTIYSNTHVFRVPLVGRNLTAFSAWQVYVEGQK